ncbi:MAG: hypothetical protein ACE5FL_01825 [Myxococcota bacterium]
MKLLDFIIYRARHSAAIVGLSSFTLLTALFLASGATRPEVLPEFYTSFEQLLGTLILLVLIPSFLLTFLIVGQRRSMRYGRELFDRHISDRDPNAWLRPIRARIPLAGAGGGFVYALTLNTPIVWLIGFSDLTFQEQAIVIGQVVLWTVVGVTLSVRLHTALAFNRLGKTANFDLLDIQRIGAFSKNGVDDVLVVVLLLALSTVQSLDARFRFENYAAAMLVAIPSATFLFLLPMISIHRRLVRARADSLEALTRSFDGASRERTPEAIQEIEALLQHRDRIRDTLTWPIDGSTYSRLAVYVIIPPIAWFGAAFVEFGVGRVLNGP